MRHIVLGTAGHVDHGKTELVRRLTGVDTDRLDEEKQRGMTINLGFAPFLLPDGSQLAIIDVPGHERFIKTMVAGVMGIDLILLVIAADEGVMPQTREHVDIVTLLGVRHGVVALTKSDLVEPDWLEMVMAEVQDFLDATPLACASILPVSAKTGEGIDKLVAAIMAAKADIPDKDASNSAFRLPVDRVFAMEGHGTIVTGTIYGGSIHKGNQVVVLPQNKEAKVRNIQVHGQGVHMASAGERCALNLTGVVTDDIKRGDTVAYPGTLGVTKQFDAVLTSVKRSSVITHGQRVRLHLGTAEVMAKIRVIGDDIIPGVTEYVQFYTEEPVVALRGDRYIVRSFSPITTIGGGQVLLPNAPRRRRYDPRHRRELEIEATGSPRELIHLVLARERQHLARGLASIPPVSPRELSHMVHLPEMSVRAVLLDGGFVDMGNKYMAEEDYLAAARAVRGILETLQAKAPFRLGIDREELRSSLFANWERRDFAGVLERWSQETIILVEGPWVGDPEVYGRLIQGNDPALQELEAIILDAGLQVRTVAEMASLLSYPLDFAKDMLELLLHVGKVVQIAPGMILHQESIQKAIQTVGEHLAAEGLITVGELRDSLKTNRKMAVALLEYFDGQGITRREGEGRVPGPRLADALLG